jgi:hypothetical protein
MMASVFGIFDVLGVPDIGMWGEPRVWIAAAGIIVIIAFLMIYYKVFTSGKGP